MPKLSLWQKHTLDLLNKVGIELKPIRLRRSLYILIPSEVAKLTGLTNETKLILTLKHGNECVLLYQKVETQPTHPNADSLDKSKVDSTLTN